MKNGKFAGKMLATLALSAITMCSNAQFLQSTVQEDVYPALTSGIPAKCSNTSAYSYGGLTINSVLSDLYVYTWDGGDNLLGSAGFAVRQYPAGTSVVLGGTLPTAEESNPLGFPQDDAASIEAVILQDGTVVCIALTYYKISDGRFYYDLYEWDPSATPALTQSTAANIPNDLASSIIPTGPLPFSWIRMDAVNLEEYAIAYEHNGRVIMHASDDPEEPNYAKAMDHSFSLLPAMMPDIALSKINYGPALI